MILVTGGARSGKSSYGESLLADLDNVLYIATSIPFDDEMKDRVKKHRESRSSDWETLELYKDFEGKIENKYDGIILDCITIMVTNLLIEKVDELKEDYNLIEAYIMEQVRRMVDVLRQLDSKIVLITNEVGAGIVPENKMSREFRDIAGRVNQYLGKQCEEVYLAVSGIPVKIK